MNILFERVGLFLICCVCTIFVSINSQAGELVMIVTDGEGLPKQGVVIEVISPRLPVPEDWPGTGVIDQVNKEFVNPVIAITENSVVSFPNSDDIHHHVYSFSDTKRFELPLYTGNTAQPVLFDKAGIVTIGCNIHDWMLGYIYVGQSHLMAVTDQHGLGSIANLPAGTYTVSLWHSGLRPGIALPEHSVAISADGISQYNVSLESQSVLPLRRAPLPGLRNY